MRICEARGSHTYYEHGMCFECDKPQHSKAQLMSRMRKARKSAGLVRCEFWLTPEQRERVKKYLARLQKSDA